jgi:hypothetical protein
MVRREHARMTRKTSHACRASACLQCHADTEHLCNRCTPHVCLSYPWKRCSPYLYDIAACLALGTCLLLCYLGLAFGESPLQCVSLITYKCLRDLRSCRYIEAMKGAGIDM